MYLWHLEPDTPRFPIRPSAGEWVTLDIGTSPVEPGQAVWVIFAVTPGEARRVAAVWRYNDGPNSYWRAEIGPFAVGDVVEYRVWGRSQAGEIAGPAASFRVGPKLYLALLWHQHQPLYKDSAHPTPRESYRQPWVRLHAIRDYYSMAALVAQHPGLHLTINMTPVLLWQIEDYVERGATDRALELTLRPAEVLTAQERQELLATFFDADRDNQIFPHPRYAELFGRHSSGATMKDQDLRDLQMWFNLAWFGQEFRQGDVVLATGETASVRRFVEQDRGFTAADMAALVSEQMKVMRAIIPLHRKLQDAGQIEVATTPFYHPILPLLIDTADAALDRADGSRPSRFRHPEDAIEQVQLAVMHYEHCFGRRPRGMWPAEGAVSPAVVPLFANSGVSWIATDAGVLARSGRWGYRADEPDVLCRPYRLAESALCAFFRDPWLADHIGFHYQRYADYDAAAGEFVSQIKDRYIRRLAGGRDGILTIVLDGENAWSTYRDDARPFLHALYTRLEQDTEIQTVTFDEYLRGNPLRGVEAHPVNALARIDRLAVGSWIDEAGSAPGVDLGTWIGEPEENRAWELLRRVRDDLAAPGAA